MSKHIPPKGAEIDLWILYSHESSGTYIEGIFTHRVQAEAMKRYLMEEDGSGRKHVTYAIYERTTQPHGEGQ